MLQKIYPIFIDVVQNLYKFITSSKYVNLAALIVPDNDALKFTKSMIKLELLRRTRIEIIVLTEPNLLFSSIRHLETSYVSLSSA